MKSENGQWTVKSLQWKTDSRQLLKKVDSTQETGIYVSDIHIKVSS